MGKQEQISRCPNLQPARIAAIRRQRSWFIQTVAKNIKERVNTAVNFVMAKLSVGGDPASLAMRA
jgi:hypothetical protein